jgi:hypothetical protein
MRRILLCRQVVMTSNRYAIGYQKPPANRQFKPGVSGNPSGRPKRGPTFTADLLNELNELTLIKDGDHEFEVTKQRALARNLVTSALSGDPRALQLLISLCRDSDATADTLPNTTFSEADLKALSELLQNVQQSKNHTDPTTC